MSKVSRAVLGWNAQATIARPAGQPLQSNVLSLTFSTIHHTQADLSILTPSCIVHLLGTGMAWDGQPLSERNKKQWRRQVATTKAAIDQWCASECRTSTAHSEHSWPSSGIIDGRLSEGWYVVEGLFEPIVIGSS